MDDAGFAVLVLAGLLLLVLDGFAVLVLAGLLLLVLDVFAVLALAGLLLLVLDGFAVLVLAGLLLLLVLAGFVVLELAGLLLLLVLAGFAVLELAGLLLLVLVFEGFELLLVVEGFEEEFPEEADLFPLDDVEGLELLELPDELLGLELLLEVVCSPALGTYEVIDIEVILLLPLTVEVILKCSVLNLPSLYLMERLPVKSMVLSRISFCARVTIL